MPSVGCSCLVGGCLAIPPLPTSSVPRFFMVSNYQIKLVLKENLSQLELEVAKRYWFFKGGAFKEKPTEIARSLKLTTSKVSKIAKESGYLEISSDCSQCKTKRDYTLHSQTKVKEIVAPLHVCYVCKEEAQKIRLEKLKAEAERISKYRAIKFSFKTNFI